MKLKRIKKFSIVFLAMLSVAGLFAVPVSAKSTGWNSDTYSMAQLFDTSSVDLYFRWSTQGQNVNTGKNNDNEYYFSIPSNWLLSSSNGEIQYTGRFNSGIASYEKGDTVYMRIPMYFVFTDYGMKPNAGWMPPMASASLITSGAQTAYATVNVEPILDDDFYSGGDTFVCDFVFEFQAKEALTFSHIAFSFSFPHSKSFSSVGFFGLVEDASVEYGDANSPEAPNYVKPDGGKLEDLEDLEQGLQEDTNEGYDSANDAFSGFADHMFGFVAGLQIVSVIMGYAIMQLPFANALVQVSLALGLFAVVVGLTSSIIGARRGK